MGKIPNYHRTRPNVQKPSPDRENLSPRGSQAITGFGLNATMYLLHTKQMPAIKIGRRFLIPRAALLKWLAESAAGLTVEL
jgi:excisionase family DNA binding protein